MRGNNTIKTIGIFVCGLVAGTLILIMLFPAYGMMIVLIGVVYEDGYHTIAFIVGGLMIIFAIATIVVSAYQTAIDLGRRE